MNIRDIINLKNMGYSSRQIASMTGVSKTTVNDTYNRWKNSETKDGPTILFFDLESAPSITATFGRWNVNISQDNVIREGGFLLSAAWKTNMEPVVNCSVMTGKEAKTGDDSRILANLYEAFESADIVCAHNLDKFDLPLFKTRLVVNGMPPPRKVKTIDTLKIAKQLKFNSNKLDSLAKILLQDEKQSTSGIELWIRCMNGDENALKEMSEYNCKDVSLLERLYYNLRAFDGRAPNAGLFYDDGEHHCPVCGSDDVAATGNVVTTQVSEFAEMSCGSCGHRSRVRKSFTEKAKRSLILV